MRILVILLTLISVALFIAGIVQLCKQPNWISFGILLTQIITSIATLVALKFTK